MIIQQIYWQSVWGASVKKFKGEGSCSSHTKEEELTLKRMLIERRGRKPGGRR